MRVSRQEFLRATDSLSRSHTHRAPYTLAKPLKRMDAISDIQGTCGATSRHLAEQHPERLSRYIRAYVEATQWCLDRRNRRSCLDILARHNEIDGPAAEHTLDTLLDPEHGLYPKATINLPGVAAALDLRGELGYLARPVPPVEKYVDLSYYRKALSIGT